jgi:hypothetical protein
VEDAVDAEAHEQAVVLRLDVDVGGAVLGRLEDDRVDEPDKRRIGDAVVDLEVVGFLLFLRGRELLLDHRARAERFGGASETADLGKDVLACRDAQVERVTRRDPQLVDRLDVARIGESDLQRSVRERVRHRDDALEHMQWDLVGGLVVDAREREVDEGHLVASGERTRDAFARRDVLLDQRLRERAALAHAAPDQRELVGRDEAG